MIINLDKVLQNQNRWLQEESANSFWNELVSRSDSLLKGFELTNDDNFTEKTYVMVDDFRNYGLKLVEDFFLRKEKSLILNNYYDIWEKNIFFDTLITESINEMAYFTTIVNNGTLSVDKEFSNIHIRYLFHSFYNKIDNVRKIYQDSINAVNNIDRYISDEKFRKDIDDKHVDRKSFYFYNNKTEKFTKKTDEILSFNKDLQIIQRLRNKEVHEIPDLANRIHFSIINNSDYLYSPKFGLFWVIVAMLIWTIDQLNRLLKEHSSDGNLDSYKKYFDIKNRIIKN